MEGANGCSHSTHGTKLKMMLVGPRGYVQDQCIEQHEYGRILVAEYMSDIEDA